jgi:hypothetical protein
MRNDPVPTIEDMIQDLQTLVGHPYFIEIREYQTKFQEIGVKAAADRMQLPADILTRLTHQRQYPVKVYLFVYGHSKKKWAAPLLRESRATGQTIFKI